MAMTQYKGKARRMLGRFAGKWVALLDDEVIESAATLSNLMAKVRRRRLTRKPSVMLVPRKDEGPYILTIRI